MRIALYARVSTVDQSCEMQLRELRDYAARRGWTAVDEYVDTGWSGAHGTYHADSANFLTPAYVSGRKGFVGAVG
jgi:hypothetical protein